MAEPSQPRETCPCFKGDTISKSASRREDVRPDTGVPRDVPSPVFLEPDLQVGLVAHADKKILPTQEPEDLEQL